MSDAVTAILVASVALPAFAFGLFVGRALVKLRLSRAERVIRNYLRLRKEVSGFVPRADWAMDQAIRLDDEDQDRKCLVDSGYRSLPSNVRPLVVKK